MSELRIGNISTINATKGTARVIYKDRGGSLSPEMPLLSQEYNMPNVNDQVLCFIFENSCYGFILGGIWNEKNRPDVKSKDIFLKKYSNGVTLKVDKNNKTLEIDASKMDLSGVSEITIKAPTINLNGKVLINGKDIESL